MIEVMNELSTVFDNKIDNANVDMMYGITSFMESCNDDLFIEKKVQQSFTVKVKNFFAELVAAFKHFVDSITIEVNKRVRSAEFDKKLRALHKELHEKKRSGVSTVTVNDVWGMRDKYLAATKGLKKIAQRMSKCNYKHVQQIDDDIEVFEKTMEEYKEALEEASSKKVEVSIDKMLEFIEDEVSGRGHVISSLNDAVAMLEQMQKDCELMATKEALYGADVIAKHASVLRRVGTSISKFIKKWSVKIISTTIILIGS